MRLRNCGLAIVFLLGAMPSLAHHALQAEFDTTKRVEFTGVLTRFALINPHVRWFFDVKNPNGSVDKWEVSAAGAGPIRQAGLARVFKVGDTYKVSAAPARNGSKSGRVVDFKFPDGRVVVLYHENPDNPNDL
jgi:uncharacterized protein DUF6152